MLRHLCHLVLLLAGIPVCISAQTDSLQKINSGTEQQQIFSIAPSYIKEVNGKITKYNQAVFLKMEKTLIRLSKWENRIKRALEKTSPETAARLFTLNQPTFSSMLEKLQKAKSLTSDYTSRFSHYTDKLNTRVKYLQASKSKLSEASGISLDSTASNLSKQRSVTADAEFLQEFIRERRKQLLTAGLQYLGKTKYMAKLNKESLYYSAAIQNYKEILSDPKRTEKLVASLLTKIPAFKEFAAQQSGLAGVFSPLPVGGGATMGSTPIINGLAPRAAVQQFISGTGTTNAGALGQQLQGGSAAPSISPVNLESLKNKLDVNRNTGEALTIPEPKLNSQRTKTFRQRLEAGSDFKFGQSTGWMPANLTTGLTLGYKFSDKQSAGIGINYVLGLGNGWKHIRFSNEGLGFRSYVKWKFKHNIFFQAGSEWTYLFSFKKIEELKTIKNWQQATLVGLSKGYTINKKVKGNIQVLYNLMHRQNIPHTQPVVIRFGYGF